MICSKCGSNNQDGSVFCSVCGNALESQGHAIQHSSKQTKGKSLGVIVIIFGIIAGISFFIAGWQINIGASDMVTLCSQSGTSLAEIYYQDMGKALMGFAILARAMGILTIVITVVLGNRIRH